MIPKFRAWVPNEKLLTIVLNIDFTGDGIITARDANDFVVLYPFNEIKLMQYTGLKDKNGKEIYEGDIIKYRYDEDHPYMYLNVYREQESASFFVGYLKWSAVLPTCEVVGNIYENKELLK